MIVEKTIQESKTLQFSLKAQEMKRMGREIISLGLGEPDFDTPEHIKRAAVEALNADLTRYSAAAGLPELRELVAQKLSLENGFDAEPDEIIITPGAKNALAIACMAVLQPGDEVINFTPCYVSNNPILELAEPRCVVHNVPLMGSDFRVDRNRIEDLVNERTRLILVNYPNNPTGTMIRGDDAEFIRGIVEEHNLFLLSDEVYERLILSDTPHISFAAFDDIRCKVITINGFSKAHSMTGWRIGYVHANRPLVSVMLKIHQHLNTNTAAFIQKAAVAALEGPQTHVLRFIEAIRERRDYYNRFISDHPGLSGSEIQGGFLGFINIKNSGLSSDDFCSRLLEEKGVAMIPGISFGADFDGWVRISLANNTELVAEGLRRTGEFIRCKM
ncbi:MAG: pyridoxal phosphate-dependent aminotransferase [Armatimonadetes bacterium]|nr:pyridoxal phosphate-dependent aminotransferase [Armatimonadota bacterium]